MILFTQSLKIYFYSSSSGNNVVKEYIQELPKRHGEKIVSIIKAFETYGFHLETRYLRRLSGTKSLWELRIKYQNNQYRIFLAKIGEDAVILLHIITKKSQKTPRKDIETAAKRLKSLLSMI